MIGKEKHVLELKSIFENYTPVTKEFWVLIESISIFLILTKMKVIKK